MKRAWFCLLAGCVLLAGQVWAGGPDGLTRLAGQSMGMEWRLSLRLPPDLAAARARIGVQAELDAVDRQMSTWKSDSDLSRFNRARAGQCQVLPMAFFEVLQKALRLARDSGGAYDPTVGPLVNLWGFGPMTRPHRVPSAQALAAARAQVGWQRLHPNPLDRSLCQPGGVYLDLSSVAKGYAVDQAAQWLLAHGVADFLLEVGGEVRAHGHRPGGSGWRVGVERPGAAEARVEQVDELALVLVLHDQAMATSGNYRHYFEDAGHAYSHHIDPRTGWPVTHDLASVTVVAPTTFEADPVGTTLMVLGPEAGMAWARQRKLAVLMLLRNQDGSLQTRMSPAFKALLRK